VVMKSSSLQLVLESVAQGTGISILPQIFGNPAERPRGIVARPILCDEFSDIHFHFFSRSGRRMNPSALALQSAIVREVQAMQVVDLKRALA
jgi:LysR family transcriptional activator of glutamate synthase operon